MSHIRVDLLNMNNKWVGFVLANVDTFIIRVRFGLANIDTIRILTRHEHNPSTRIATPIHTSIPTTNQLYFSHIFPSLSIYFYNNYF